jgi:hypothetical protein
MPQCARIVNKKALLDRVGKADGRTDAVGSNETRDSRTQLSMAEGDDQTHNEHVRIEGIPQAFLRLGVLRVGPAPQGPLP